MFTYSIIIVAKNKNEILPLLKHLESLSYDLSSYEIITSFGNNPSNQRNQAAKIATGDKLLFLDNDSIPHNKLLHYYNDAYSYSDSIKIAGGPSCEGQKSSIFQSSIGIVFSSIFGTGPIRSRYLPIGEVRNSSERELILCNLSVNRDTFLESGGFNNQLHPNEENEFLNRFSKNEIVYHPLCIVYRFQRKNFYEFSIQMIRYGQGRSKHFKLKPSINDLIFFIPAIFSIYILSLSFIFTSLSPLIHSIPIILYLIINLIISSTSFFLLNKSKSFITLPIVFFFCHFFYGIGTIIGGVKKRKKKKEKKSPEINIIKFFKPNHLKSSSNF